MPDGPQFCDDHKRMSADVERYQRWIGDVEQKVDHHSGDDHFRRREHDEFVAKQARDTQTMTEMQSRLLDRLEASEKALGDHTQAQALDNVSANRKITVAQFVVSGLVSIIVGALGVLGTYLLLAAKIGH